MKKRYPRSLSAGANNAVIAIDKKEVGKLFVGDTRSDIGSEAEKMKFANKINSLVVKFIKLDVNENLNADMLVMERLYPIDFRAFEFEKRELWFSVFEDEIAELHKNGFVHRDIARPSNIKGFKYDNIFLTETGLRLIDVGISAIKQNVGEKIFMRYIEQELKEIKEFGDFFLMR